MCFQWMKTGVKICVNNRPCKEKINSQTPWEQNLIKLPSIVVFFTKFIHVYHTICIIAHSFFFKQYFNYATPIIVDYYLPILILSYHLSKDWLYKNDTICSTVTSFIFQRTRISTNVKCSKKKILWALKQYIRFTTWCLD